MSKQTKIIHIVGDSKFGGGAIIILRLAEMAKRLGWQVDVLTTDPSFQEVLRDAGIGTVNLNVIWRDIRPLRDLAGLFRLYRFLLNSDYDLIHTHTSKAGFVGRLAGWLAQCHGIIHTVHGFAFHEESSSTSIRLYVLLEKFASRWCDKIVTVSLFHRKWALELGICKEQKIIAIPNGITPDRVIPDTEAQNLRKLCQGSEKAIVIMAIGRIAPQKGLEFLVQAIPALAQRLPVPFKIVFAGNGSLRANLEQIAEEMGVGDKILFLGFRRDIGNLLASCDLVVLPSLREGLSIALLEAMAAGKPIITTTIGSNKEVVCNGDGALLIPPKSADALADAIVSLANDKQKADYLGAKGKEIFLSNYTEEQMMKKYEEVYTEILNLYEKRSTGNIGI